MPKAKVMIVEDEVLSAAALEMCLEVLGFETCPLATCSEEALTIVSNARPDVILMDISLPGALNGIDLANEIWFRFSIPIIFMSGYAKEDMPEAMKCPGARGYITKPYDVSQLEAVMESVMESLAAAV